MRKILILLILSMILACGSVSLATDENTSEYHPDLIGLIDKSSLSQEPYLSWFEKNHSNYTPEKTVIEQFSETINDHQIKVFMGTWCHDSQRETPRLYKILEAASYDLENLNLIALDQSKTTPEQLENGMDIQRTPTFIFYKDGVEVGRIVETPRESLEEDILKIISGQKYKHSYQD